MERCEFFNRATNSQEDVAQKFINILENTQIPYAIYVSER